MYASISTCHCTIVRHSLVISMEIDTYTNIQAYIYEDEVSSCIRRCDMNDIFLLFFACCICHLYILFPLFHFTMTELLNVFVYFQFQYVKTMHKNCIGQSRWIPHGMGCIQVSGVSTNYTKQVYIHWLIKYNNEI